MSKVSENHNWSQEDLTIAYYFAKWGLSGLGLSEEELVIVIGETTRPSLLKQAANFRAYLNIEGFKLGENKTPCPKKQLTLDTLKDKTITQVRKMVLKTIDSRSDLIEKVRISKQNQTAFQKRDELNEELRKNHENKMKSISQFRRLKRINKK